MNKKSPADLLLIVQLFEHGCSSNGVARRADCSRRSLYNWLDESQAAADQGSASPYFIPERNKHFHEAVTEARMLAQEPWNTPEPLPEQGLTRAELQAIQDAAENDEFPPGFVERKLAAMPNAKPPYGLHLSERADQRHRKLERRRAAQAEAAGAERPDIAELRALAREWANKPKHAGRAIIGRENYPGDPQEHVTAQPKPKSVAERERSHPRAAPEGWMGPPLHKPDPPRPAWAKVAPLDRATIGRGVEGRPPEEGRMTISSRSYSRAEVIKHGPLALRGPDGRPIK